MRNIRTFDGVKKDLEANKKILLKEKATHLMNIQETLLNNKKSFHKMFENNVKQ